jgi:HEAT repeat protein
MLAGTGEAGALSDADLASVAGWTGREPDAPAIRQAFEAALVDLGADAGGLADLQRRLLPRLAAPGTTPWGRDLILRAVQRMGFCVDVPAVAALLTDPAMSHRARLALEGIADPKVDAALLAALTKAEGDARTGIVISMGLRRSVDAVPAITPLCGSSDVNLASGALTALGRIATPACLDRLLQPVAPAVEAVRHAALAQCLGRMSEGRDAATAVKAARHVLAGDPSTSPALRAAGVLVVLKADPRTAPEVLAQALADPHPKVREAAARAAATGLKGDGVTDALTAALKGAAVDDGVRILGALMERGDRRAAPAVSALLDTGDVLVRRAAVAALGAIGGTADADRLAGLLADEAVREGATRALSSMPAEGVTGRLAALAASSADAAQRARLVQVLGARAGTEGLTVLSLFAGDADRGVRREVWKALRDRARPADAGALAELMSAAPAEDASVAEAAVGAAVRPMEPAARSALLVAAWEKAPPAAKPALARTMAYFADAPSLQVLTAAMKDADPGIQEAAVRAVAAWPGSDPAEALCAASFDLPKESLRVLALRGAVRMLGAAPGVDARARLSDLFRKAPDSAGRQVVAAAIGERIGIEAFGVFEGWFGDGTLGPDAKKAYVALYDQMRNSPAGEVDTKGWRAEASHRGDGTGRAFDRKEETRWDTGTPQVPGMWFALDLARVANVARIDLETGRSPGDTPNRYKVFTSMDGKSWNGPVAEGEGGQGSTAIPIQPPVPARWIRIEQGGERPGLFWSIHEIKVTAGVDEALLKTVAEKAAALAGGK